MPLDAISASLPAAPALPADPSAARRRRRGQKADAWGRAAEEVVAQAYSADGGQIIATRWRTAAGEIDLVVRSGATLVFVEVKARRNGRDALEAMSPARWRRLATAAEAFVAEQGDPLADIRIDLATMDRSGAVTILENVSVDF